MLVFFLCFDGLTMLGHEVDGEREDIPSRLLNV